MQDLNSFVHYILAFLSSGSIAQEKQYSGREVFLFFLLPFRVFFSNTLNQANLQLPQPGPPPSLCCWWFVLMWALRSEAAQGAQPAKGSKESNFLSQFPELAHYAVAWVAAGRELSQLSSGLVWGEVPEKPRDPRHAKGNHPAGSPRVTRTVITFGQVVN